MSFSFSPHLVCFTILMSKTENDKNPHVNIWAKNVYFVPLLWENGAKMSNVAFEDLSVY